jgi:hypothetical protein
MASTTYPLDQIFILQDAARQSNDLTAPPGCDAGPLRKLQSADRLVGKNSQDASTDRRWSAHGHTDPICPASGKPPSNMAAPATA